MTAERKQETLQTGIEATADEGYSSPRARSLARASGMKLGALQYHFRTWEELLRCIVGYIDKYIAKRSKVRTSSSAPRVLLKLWSLCSQIRLSLKKLCSETSCGQNCGLLEQVEPLVSDLRFARRC